MAIKLETTNEVEWEGTWALTLAFLVNDLLSDGKPFQAVIDYETEWQGSASRMTVVVSEMVDDAIVLADADGITRQVPLGNVTYFEVV